MSDLTSQLLQTVSIGDMAALSGNITVDGHERQFLQPDNVTINADQQLMMYDSILAGVFIGVIILAIVFGNCMVIIAVLKDRHLKQAPQNRFILSLAAADMLIGVFIMPISLTQQILDYWALGPVLCELWLASDVFLCTASTLSLVVVSVDRYWSVTNALEYPQLRTSMKVNIVIVGIWLTSAFVSLPPLAGWKSNSTTVKDFHERCNLSNELGYIIYSLTISFYIPLIIIFIAYGRIFQVARRRANQHVKLGTIHNSANTNLTNADTPSQIISDASLTPFSDNDSSTGETNADGTNNHTAKDDEHTDGEDEEPPSRKFTVFASRFMHRPSKTNPKDVKQVQVLLRDQQQMRRLRNQRGRERRATITIAVIVLAFAVCWLPFSLVYLIDRVCECGVRETKAFAAIFWLGYCNSAVNPILYSIFNRDFRQAFERLLCKSRRK